MDIRSDLGALTLYGHDQINLLIAMAISQETKVRFRELLGSFIPFFSGFCPTRPYFNEVLIE